jgi:hypothetical protein
MTNFKVLFAYHQENHTPMATYNSMLLKQKQMPPLYTAVSTWNKLNMYTIIMLTCTNNLISDGDVFIRLHTTLIQCSCSTASIIQQSTHKTTQSVIQNTRPTQSQWSPKQCAQITNTWSFFLSTYFGSRVGIISIATKLHVGQLWVK